MKSSMLLLAILSLFSIGCLQWTGDRPNYFQRIVDNNQRVPGRPIRWSDPIQKQVMIGNPLNVEIRVAVNCDDWAWEDGEIKLIKIAPHKEFSVLIDSTVLDEYKVACHVVSWKRLP